MPNATARTIGVLTAVGQFLGFLFEIPSGYISDRIGHKNALIIARIALILSTACYLFANSIVWFFIGALLLSIGFAFNSGTASAFMHDTLLDLGKEDKYAKIMGNIKSVGFAVPIIFIILLPIIAETSFRWAFGVALIIDIVGLVSVISMYAPSSQVEIEEISITNFKKTCVAWYNTGWFRYVIILMLVGGIAFGGSAGFKNPYQELLGFSISSLGVLWAISRGIISLLLLFNGWIYHTFSFRQFILFKSFIQMLGYLIIGLTGNMWVIASMFIMLTACNWGLHSAENQYLLGFIKSSKSKATLLSINQLLFQLISGLFGLLMGFLVAGYSYSVAYFVLGGILLAVLIISIFYIKNPTQESGTVH